MDETTPATGSRSWPFRLAHWPLDLLRTLLRVIPQAVDRYFADRCTQHAAGIAYRVLFSLVPLSIVLVAIFGLVLRNDHLRRRRDQGDRRHPPPLGQGHGKRHSRDREAREAGERPGPDQPPRLRLGRDGDDGRAARRARGRDGRRTRTAGRAREARRRDPPRRNRRARPRRRRPQPRDPARVGFVRTS